MPLLKRGGQFLDYIRIARLDHSTKHVFIIPGAILSYLLRGNCAQSLILNIVLGSASAVCIASANYVINEWFDREFDKYHPSKKHRTAVTVVLKGSAIALEWMILVSLGLVLALVTSRAMFAICTLFALQGIAYNVYPFRTKDRPYLDVISESINNPLRLAIGWAMVDPHTLPPSSLLLCYWTGGAFLMVAKRLSEYREIVASHGREVLVQYRASFAGYSDVTLTVSCFVYGLLSNFFLGIFLIKYRIEYIISMPFVILLFSYYLSMAMNPGSSAQRPEKLFHDKRLIFIIISLVLVFVLATFINIPELSALTAQRYIELP